MDKEPASLALIFALWLTGYVTLVELFNHSLFPCKTVIKIFLSLSQGLSWELNETLGVRCSDRVWYVVKTK